jgi:hypothetical protein
MKRAFSLALFLWATATAFARTDSIPAIDLSGFADLYYAFDFNRPGNHERPAFLYNHNRHNEFNLNLGILSLKVDGGDYRAALGLMAGTYAQYNLAQEQGLLKNVFEANAGLALNKNRSLWLDAGIFSSHIGFESAISADNYTHTRSILAENSPYYLAGAKLSWDAGEKWGLTLLVLNGWQRIRRVEGSSLPALGSQVVFYPGEGIRLNWSAFAGTDDPDSTRRMRYFSNFYGEFRFSEKLWLIAGFDLGLQQQARGVRDYDLWMSPAAILRFAPAARWAVALRGEYYEDENGVIIATGTPSGFKTAGLSLNIDRLIGGNAMFRVEGRWLRSEDPIFETREGLSRHNLLLLGAITVKIP